MSSEYTLTDTVLGKGGMGIVYLAERQFLGLDLSAPAACKVMRDEYASDPDFRDLFKREALVTLGLSHPNLVQTYDVFCQDDKLHLAMEYVEGLSLYETASRLPRLPEKHVIAVAVEVAKGLEYLHSLDIRHRDVAPSNILLSKRGNVKLADFGLAKHSNDEGSFEGFKGRLQYTSPDLIQGYQPNEQTDIWALLVTLFEALNGYRPFDERRVDDALGLYGQIVAGSIRPCVPELSLGAKALFVDLTCVKPERRNFQTCADLRRALRALKLVFRPFSASWSGVCTSVKPNVSTHFWELSKTNVPGRFTDQSYGSA